MQLHDHDAYCDTSAFWRRFRGYLPVGLVSQLGNPTGKFVFAPNPSAFHQCRYYNHYLYANSFLDLWSLYLGNFYPVSDKLRSTKMKKAVKPEPLQCPCCRKSRPESECCVFISQIALDVPKMIYVTLKGNIIGNLYWIDARRNKIDWACDECLQQKRALRGKPKQQLFCDFAPHFAYFDKKITCRDCGTGFLFSKEEQAYYYEVLGFWAQANRVRCNVCQDLKRKKERLSQLLVNPDYNDLDQAKEIVTLRLEFKQYRQAKHFLALGKKQHIKGNEAYQVFDNLRKQVDETEKLDLN
jgi:hypothetical protein